MFGSMSQRLGISIGRRILDACASQVAPQRHGRVRLSLTMTLAASLATIAVGAPSFAHAAAGILSCERLEQNCEAYMARMRRALAHTRADQAGQRDTHETSAERCQEQYAAAERTGIWPAHGATPDLPCTK